MRATAKDGGMKRFLRDQSGATAIEYSLLAALAAVAAITALFTFRDAAGRLFGVVLAGVLSGTS